MATLTWDKVGSEDIRGHSQNFAELASTFGSQIDSNFHSLFSKPIKNYDRDISNLQESVNVLRESYENLGSMFSKQQSSIQNANLVAQEAYDKAIAYRKYALDSFKKNEVIAPKEEFEKQNSSANYNSSTSYKGTVNGRLYKKSSTFGGHREVIERVANEYGIDPKQFLGYAHIESNFDTNAQNNLYGGLFAINKKDNPNWRDPETNARVAAKLYLNNRRYYQGKFGKDSPYTAGHAYLYHQQGMGGATALLDPKNANRDAAEVLSQFAYGGQKRTPEWVQKHVIEKNGIKKGTKVTASEFAEKWISDGNGVVGLYS